MSPNTSILDQILAAYPHPEKVHMKDRPRVQKLVDKFVKDGVNSLQTVMDFDETITKFANGKLTSYGIVVLYSLFPEETRKVLDDLYFRYHEIEIDDNMTADEKTPLMVEWYEEKHRILASTNLTKSLLSRMVAESGVMLRERAGEALRLLSKHDVPTLILSAGLGDVVNEVLRSESLDLSTIKTVSNFMETDDGGDNLIRFKDHIIHCYNKSESSLQQDHSEFWGDIGKRNNVVTLGDTLGDASMVDETEQKPVLRIGFLNNKVPERLPAHLKHFDVVLAEDDTFEFLMLLLQHIMKP